jgi:HlyD family secretion protein
VSNDNLVRQAELQLEQFKHESQNALEVQQNRLRTLEEQRTTVDKELQRLKKRSNEIISPRELSLLELALRQAEEELATGRIVLDNLRTSRDLGLKTATTRLETAKAERDRLLKEVPIQSLTNSLALAQVRLDRTILCAPCSGKVLKVLTRPGETIGAAPLLLLADLTRMVAIAEVYETDHQYLQENVPATVTSPAFPRPLNGTVIRIGRLVSSNRVLDLNPTADADRRVVEVQVRLDEGPDTVLAGDLLNLQVTVTLARKPITP